MKSEIIEEVHKIFCYIHLKQIIYFLNFFPSIFEMPKEIKFVSKNLTMKLSTTNLKFFLTFGIQKVALL